MLTPCKQTLSWVKSATSTAGNFFKLNTWKTKHNPTSAHNWMTAVRPGPVTNVNGHSISNPIGMTSSVSCLFTHSLRTHKSGHKFPIIMYEQFARWPLHWCRSTYNNWCDMWAMSWSSVWYSILPLYSMNDGFGRGGAGNAFSRTGRVRVWVSFDALKLLRVL